MILICLDNFAYNERFYPSRSVRLSNNNVNFRTENKKLVKKRLVLKFENFHVELRDFKC